MNHSHDEYRPHQLYRDSERGVILGVCAGLAEFVDCPVWLARIGVLALCWFFPLTGALAYAVGALIMPARPLRYCGTGDERSCWQSRHYRS